LPKKINPTSNDQLQQRRRIRGLGYVAGCTHTALRRNDAAPRDVTIESFKEEFASHMEQRSSNAVSRILRGEFVGRMELRHGNDAASRDVPTLL
jgi:hypothetical protein